MTKMNIKNVCVTTGG